MHALYYKPDKFNLFYILCKYFFSNLTPTSAVAKNDDFFCDNERQRMTQKNGAFGNPLDVLVYAQHGRELMR